jgi:hypothetical protein
MKTTKENTKASVKNVNNFTKFWNNLKENKGTINKCLIDFKNSVELSKDDDFVKYCKNIFAKYESNKALNKAYYDKIKDTFKIGSIVSYKKNDDTIVQYERKCSEYDIYKYFYNLHKKANESK